MIQSQNLKAFEPNKYKILYLDPPWEFKAYSQKGEGKSAQKHYSCMSIDNLMKMPIGDLGYKDSIMLMWATSPMLPQQIECMKAWGYIYKTVAFNWIKLNKKSGTPFIGMGYYSRANAEFCLLGRKGSPGRPKNKSISQIILDPIREHSRKPDIMYSYIEQMYDGPYLELFGRTGRPNWDTFGNQTELFDSKQTITTLFD